MVITDDVGIVSFSNADMDLPLLESDKKAVKFEGIGEIWSGGINVYVYMAFSLLSGDQNFIGGGSISQFYAKIWFYMIVISFIMIVSCFSCWVIEPKINKKIENILNTFQRQCNS